MAEVKGYGPQNATVGPTPRSAFADLLDRLKGAMAQAEADVQEAPEGRSMIERGVGAAAKGATSGARFLVDALIGRAPEAWRDSAAGRPVVRKPNSTESWMRANEPLVDALGMVPTPNMGAEGVALAVLPMVRARKLGEKAVELNRAVMPNIETTVDNLRVAQGPRGGALELYSPSIGLTRSGLMQHFYGNAPEQAHLIPRVGAFDPATSPTVLNNRDFYSPRYGSFAGKNKARSFEEGRDTADKVLNLQPGFAGDQQLFNALMKNLEFQSQVPSSLMDQIFEIPAPLKKKLLAETDPAGFEAAMREMFEFAPGPTSMLDGLLMKLRGAASKMTLPTDDYRLDPQQPSLRLGDRFADPGRFDKFDRTEFGVQQPEYRNWNPLMMAEGSSEFRPHIDNRHLAMQLGGHGSFEQYLRDPGGASTLLSPRTDSDFPQDDWKVDTPLWTQEFGNIFRGHDQGYYYDDATQRTVASRPELIDNPRLLKALAGKDVEVKGDIERFGADGAAELLKSTSRAVRKGFRTLPSEYAELKVLGPVQVSGDRFAGAILPPEVQNDRLYTPLLDALAKAQVPVEFASANDRRGRFDLAQQLQYSSRPVGESR